jgi:hypothetical protein
MMNLRTRERMKNTFFKKMGRYINLEQAEYILQSFRIKSNTQEGADPNNTPSHISTRLYLANS